MVRRRRFWSGLRACISGKRADRTDVSDSGARRAFEDADRLNAPFATALSLRPLWRSAEDAFRSHQRIFHISQTRYGRRPWQADFPSRVEAARALDLAVDGRVQEALAALGRLADSLGSHPETPDGMGEGSGRIGHRMTSATVCKGAGAIGYLIDDDTAASWYARSFREVGDDVSVAVILGLLLFRLGRRADAEPVLVRAVALRRDQLAICAEAERTMPGRGPLESFMTAQQDLAEAERMLAQARVG